MSLISGFGCRIKNQLDCDYPEIRNTSEEDIAVTQETYSNDQSWGRGRGERAMGSFMNH